MAYKLDLPDSTKIHSVFHVSQLKKYVGQAGVSTVIPPQLLADLELNVEPEELLEVRQVKEGKSTKLEALIKWKGLPLFEATWENVATVNHQFPGFQVSTLRTRCMFGEGIL